jgi:competence protein ComEC
MATSGDHQLHRRFLARLLSAHIVRAGAELTALWATGRTTDAVAYTAGSYFQRPLAPVAVAMIAGLGVGASFPGAHWILWALVFGIVAWMVIAIRRRRPLVVSPMALCLSMGYLSIQPWLGIDLPDNHVGRFVDQGVWQIEGRVDSGIGTKRYRWSFVLDAQHLSRENVRHAVRGFIKVTGRGPVPDLTRGDGVSLQGHLRSIRNFANPGGFDYKRHMALQGIHARVYARRKSLKRLVPASAASWRSCTETLRGHLSSRMSTALAGKSSETIALLKALILGERRQMPTEQQEAYRRAGVSHILAISGLHIGCVALAALGLFNWLFCWIPFFLARAWTRKGAALLSLGITVGYGILAGLSPSTQRAMIMAAAFLLGFWVGRRYDWTSGLALAAVVIVLISPPTVMSVSFQLSFSAVLAIFAGFHAIPVRPPPAGARRWKTISNRLLAFLWVSTLATAGTLPLVLYYFNQVSLVGLLTNLIVVPIVTMLVVPAGLAGVMASAVSAELAALFWHGAYAGLVVVGRVVSHVAGWSWAAVTTVTPSLLEIFLYFSLIGGSLYWRKLTKSRLALAVALLLLCGDGIYWGYVRYGRRQLRVTAVDVGQGSANLLELPGGDTVLIDGGGFSDNNAFDVGARILAPLLWRRKICSIDLVILTHPNSDHLNGLLFLLQHFDVKAVWSNHEPVDTAGYRKWRQLLARRRIAHYDFQSLPECFRRNGVRFDVLAPPRDFLSRRATETWRDPNNNSMVIRVSLGRVSFLMTGDIGERAELELAERYSHQRLRSTVLMVPHHGSRKSSTNRLLSAVSPAEAVISAGWRNRFGFPHGETLERLAAVGSRVWCTADSGAIQVITDGETYHVKTVRK